MDIPYLSIKKGNITGIVGPNGSGKSTLLKTLAFLEPISEGEILYMGEETSGKEFSLRKEITYLLQEPYLLKRTIYENLAYGLKLRGQTININERIHDSLLRVGLEPKDFIKREWHRLSGGETQRVALAMRLALRPKVLILDEPTANVDEESARLVKAAALSAWKEWGTTVIIATHDLNWLHDVSTEIISLYQGRVIGRDAVNIIEGGWSVIGERAKHLFADGQCIYGFSTFTNEIKAATLSPSKIKMSDVKHVRPIESNVLKGKVTQMVLASESDKVYVSAKVGDTIIKALLTLKEIKLNSVDLASEVWISFDSDDLNWIY